MRPNLFSNVEDHAKFHSDLKRHYTTHGLNEMVFWLNVLKLIIYLFIDPLVTNMVYNNNYLCTSVLNVGVQ